MPRSHPSAGRRGRQGAPRALLALLLAALALSGSRAARAEESLPAGAERETIEKLIASVAALTDATFLRNGEAYPAASAARFLREKWHARRSEVRTAEEFIDRVASFSSTTSKPYLIRFADGREVLSRDYLQAELAKLRHRAP